MHIFLTFVLPALAIGIWIVLYLAPFKENLLEWYDRRFRD